MNITTDSTSIQYKRHFLLIGEILSVREPHILSTVLGSCISVCFWEPRLRIGSMSHFTSPKWDGTGTPSNRFGDIAIRAQLKELERMGCQRINLRTHVYGGGSVICNLNTQTTAGQRNIEVARDVLQQEGLHVRDKDMGGFKGRRVEFNTFDGSIKIEAVKSVASSYCPHFNQEKHECSKCRA